MTRWAETVKAGDDPRRHDNIPPMNVPATIEFANELSKRLHLLSFTVAPFFTDSDGLEPVQ
jgi:hypothetical protein